MLRNRKKVSPSTPIESGGTKPQTPSDQTLKAETENLAGVLDVFDLAIQFNKIGQMLTELDSVTEDSTNVCASAEQLSVSVQEAASSAVKAAEFTDDTASKARQGGDQIDVTLSAFADVESSMSQIASTFQDVKGRIESTRTIIDVIEEIADQTNLLALNAAIEAARAGEQGRGFAVVASEVRKLADHTKSSLGDITEHVENLLAITDQMMQQVMNMQQQVSQGRSNATDAHGKLLQIIDDVSEISGQVSNLAAISEQQAAATSHIETNMTNVIGRLESANRKWREIGGGIQNLSVSVNNLRINMVAQTGMDRMNASEIRKVLIQDHQWWLWRVYNAIHKFAVLDPKEVGDHHSCRLGKWYQANRTSVDAAVRPDFEQAHEAVHTSARKIAEALERDDIGGVQTFKEQLDANSRKVIQYLQRFFA